MGQIVSLAAKPKRCNLNKLSQLGIPAAGEYILVSSDNSMNAAGQGNFDCYIVGDGTTAATALELKPLADEVPTSGSNNSVTSGGVYNAIHAIESDIETKDVLLFDYTSEFVAISSFSELSNAIVRKSTGLIESASGKGLLYFPIVSGHAYKVTLNNLYCEGSYGIVSFSSSVPTIGGEVIVVKSYSSSGSYTETIEYAAVSNGYLLVQYGSAAQKSRISAQGEVFTQVPKFLSKDNVDDALSEESTNPVQNKVISGKIKTIENNLFDVSYDSTSQTLTDANGYIVRESNHKVEAGSTNQGILYFPVEANKIYRIQLNALYCVSAYSTISFSTSVPAVDVITESIFNPPSTDNYTKDILYTPVANGYIFVLYNATNQRSKISATLETPIYDDHYRIRLWWKDFKWSAIGDSLTETNRTSTKKYHDYINEWTGISVQNLGVGGTGYAEGSNFYGRISQIESDADIITIFGSFNDMASSLPFGSITDTGLDTICGYIYNTLVGIRSAFPLVNLGVVTPTPWASYKPTSSGNTACEQYVDAIIEICKMQSIQCLDLFHCSNLRPWDAAFRSVAYTRDGQYSEATSSTPNAIQVTDDLLGYITTYGGLPNAQVGDWVVKDGAGVHPDEHGQLLIASRIKTFLESMISI